VFKSMFSLLLLLTIGVASAAYDPTRPPAAAAPRAAVGAAPVPMAYHLSFIVNAPERRLARINGRWVAEGDAVANARVLRIDSDSVRLRRDGRILKLTLGNGHVTKRAADVQE
jgi:hypothetical protein